MFKVCRLCCVEKPLTDFWRAKACTDGHRGECKACATELRKARYDSVSSVARAQAWRTANPERYQETQRRARARPETKHRVREAALLRKYGKTGSEVDAILVRQGGLCALCRTDEGPWNIDHDHVTGVVRGILCWPCNLVLGIFKDDPVRFEAAVRYLKDNGK